MEKLKVLIADDSIVYRSQIRSALADLPLVEVVGASSNGKLAVDRIKQNDIDLLILDLEMPEMDGLATLRELQKIGKRTKVLMFSSLSKRGAEITLEALQLGANDFVAKPGAITGSPTESAPHVYIRDLIEPKIRALFPERFGLADSAVSQEKKPAEKYATILWEVFRPKVLVIGSSTGGPHTLEKIFSGLRSPLQCPILIAQHMPPIFTATLAERLQKISGIPAAEGIHGEPLENKIYMAPGDFHMTVQESGGAVTIALDKGPMENFVRPAVDPLFRSAAQIFKDKCLGLVLTGMGSDGKNGCLKIKEAGGAVIIQDKPSSTVYGMPGAVFETGAFDKISTPDEIIGIIGEKAANHADISLAQRKRG